jgi:hypothetical protein
MIRGKNMNARANIKVNTTMSARLVVVGLVAFQLYRCLSQNSRLIPGATSLIAFLLSPFIFQNVNLHLYLHGQTGSAV